jgi:predicted dehydrogenase
MRFALLGDHPDGLEMACALAESGRHEIRAHTEPLGEEVLRRLAGARRVSDVEEVLADPAIEAVIVAGRPAVRAAQLRRALQSERHVLCVHPPDQTPEAAYEAGMIQGDTGCVLLPLSPGALHPGVVRLAQFVRRPRQEGGSPSPVGAFRLLEGEWACAGEVLVNGGAAGQKPSFLGWSVLRTLGGEIAEVSAVAEREELLPGEPVLLAGRFEQGGLFQVTLLPCQPADRCRLLVLGSAGRAELLFPVGWEGPAGLDWRDQEGETHEEYWEPWDPWAALVEEFERALGGQAPRAPRGSAASQAVTAELPRPRAGSPDENGVRRQALRWDDATRALELDDAARRSVERRRASPLEYPEASEEVGFKGTMTLAGCALLWAVLLLLVLSRWVPLAGWLIGPLLVFFLGLQLLRYLIPRNPKSQ